MTTTTMTPSRAGWTLAALMMMAPAPGLAQQASYGALADLRASVATDRPVYPLGSPPEPIEVTITLENGGSLPVLVQQDLDEHLHLELYFSGPDGPVRSKRELTSEAPEPPPPDVCLIDGEPVQVERVKVLDVGYQLTVTVPDAHAFYTLPTGEYTVELRVPVATYAALAPCEPDTATFAFLRDQNETDGGELRALPQPFAIVGDSDGDGYCYPASPGLCPPASGSLAALAWADAVDCDDRNSAVHPGAVEIPGNGLDDDCNPATPDDVVAVAGNQPPVADAGPDQTVSLGTPVTLDGRASRDPDEGPEPLTFAWIQSSGPDVALAGANTPTPSFTPAALGAYGFTLRVYDGWDVRADRTTVTVGVYAFTGFFPPVNNPPTVNVMKAGAAVPVKFSLNGDKGLEILQGAPTSSRINCDAAATTDPIEDTVAAATSALSYDPVADQYVYVWKTERTWGNQCRQFVLKLKDGTTHQASFKFTR